MWEKDEPVHPLTEGDGASEHLSTFLALAPLHRPPPHKWKVWTATRGKTKYQASGRRETETSSTLGELNYPSHLPFPPSPFQIIHPRQRHAQPLRKILGSNGEEGPQGHSVKVKYTAGTCPVYFIDGTCVIISGCSSFHGTLQLVEKSLTILCSVYIHEDPLAVMCKMNYGICTLPEISPFWVRFVSSHNGIASLG